MSGSRQALGERGEQLAERWLENRGWQIVARRFRSGHRDIDLVAACSGAAGSGRLIAFVEVKTRVSEGCGGPLAAVNWRKQRELVRSARDWMARHREAGDSYRFDVVGVLFGSGGAEVVHVENAFSVR